MHKPTSPSSARAPFMPGETWEQRHERRRQIALMDEQRFRDKLRGLKARVRILEDGKRWQIRIRARLFEWFPESGRAVADRQYTRAQKAHDVDQLAAMIRHTVE